MKKRLAIFALTLFLSFTFAPYSWGVLATTASRVNYTSTGGATYAYPFKIFANTDLDVYVNGVIRALTTDYTVTGVGIAGGGNVVFGVAPTAGAVVLIIRDVPYTQLTDYVEYGPLPAENLEQNYDKGVALSQQLLTLYGFCIQLPTTTTGITTPLYLPAPGAGQIIGWNPAGSGLSLYTYPTAGVVLTEFTDSAEFASLNAAVTWATGTGTSVTIKVAREEIINADLTVPSSVQLWFLNNGYLTTGGGITVTMAPESIVNMGDHHIFRGTGTVKFNVPSVSTSSAPSPVKPEWWGTNGADDDVQIQQAIDSLRTYRLDGLATVTRSIGQAVIELSPKTYTTSATILLYQSMTLKGAGPEKTLINFTGANDSVIEFTEDASVVANINKSFMMLSDLSIDGGGKTNIGVHSTGTVECQRTGIERVNLRDCLEGIRFEKAWCNVYRDLEITDVISGISLIPVQTGDAILQSILENVIVQKFTRFGIFASANSIDINSCTIQNDLYDGLDSPPPNHPTYDFPVGVCIYGADTATLGIQGTSKQGVTVTGNYFERILDITGTCIYIDGVSALPASVTIDDNRFTLSDSYIGINAANRVHIGRGNYFGSAIDHITVYSSDAASIYVETLQGLTSILDPTSAFDYTIESFTGTPMRYKPTNFRYDLEEIDTTATLTVLQSGRKIKTVTTDADNTLTLPDAATGLNYEVILGSAFGINILPQAADQILVKTDAAGDRVYSPGTPGNSIRLIAITSSQWAAVPYPDASWTDED